TAKDSIMLPTINFTETTAYRYLTDNYIGLSEWTLKDLFSNDPQRFAKFSLQLQVILFGYELNCSTDENMALLVQLAQVYKLDEAIQEMFSGHKINVTEGRQVLHTALRKPVGQEVLVDGEDIMPKVHAVKAQMKAFCEKIHSGEWKGFTGKAITDIVNIGI